MRERACYRAPMTRVARSAPLVALALGSLLSLGGCGQGLGERCQLDSDCQDDLRCSIPPENGGPVIGGVCVGINAVDLAINYDFAPAPDLATHD